MKTAAQGKRSLVDIAVDAIGEALQQQRWALGTRIPTEPELAEELGMSRNTVREAVRVLAFAGLLEVRQGNGTYVRALSSPAQALRSIGSASLLEHLEVRALLEEACARQAARRRAPEAIAAMRTALAARTDLDDERRLDEFIERDLAFHLAVAEGSGNRALCELYRYFSQAVRLNLRAALLDRSLPEPDQPSHRAIVDAIEAGDEAAAGLAAAIVTEPVMQVLRQRLSQQEQP